MLDLASWTWFVPRQEGASLPAPREQAAAAFSPDGRLLLFGGRANGARLNGAHLSMPASSATWRVPCTKQCWVGALMRFLNLNLKV